MKSLETGLAAHLATGVTTLCWCWRLTRRDGVTLGFTDHDRDLVFDGTAFEATAGFTASEIRDAVGLSVDNLEVESALSSTRLEEADILAGRYDGAGVEIFRVNWQAPSERALLRTGTLGEARRSGVTFTAEVRGLTDELQQTRGRLYQFSCDADLGDARCGVDLTSALHRAEGAVEAVFAGRRITASGLDDFVDGWFSRGILTFTSGLNSGTRFEIKRHAVTDDVTNIDLWEEPVETMAPGDTFLVTAGCDKQPSTCAGRFANIARFRGFPHMPGNDFMTAVARSGRARQET